MSEKMRILVAGWFSFSDGHVTAGDVLARDVILNWLCDSNIAFDVALDYPFVGGVSWRQVRPSDYTHLIFICGPFGPFPLEAEILLRFSECRLIGVNLSMSAHLDQWNPFDLLIERDSSRAGNPDLVFLSRARPSPVIGVCLVEEHPEADVARANSYIENLVGRHECAVVRIDTRLDINEVGLRTPSEVEALIARMDALVTTRLHGLVLGLKNGVPVLAVDAVPGGGKIARQCSTIGWSNIIIVDQLDEPSMDQALAFCLTDESRILAQRCVERSEELLQSVKAALLDGVSPTGDTELVFRMRSSPERFGALKIDLEKLLLQSSWKSRTPAFIRRIWKKAKSLVVSRSKRFFRR